MIKFDLSFKEWKYCPVKEDFIAIFSFNGCRKECTLDEIRYHAFDGAHKSPYKKEELLKAMESYKDMAIKVNKRTSDEKDVVEFKKPANAFPESKANDNAHVVLELEEEEPLPTYSERIRGVPRVMPKAEPESLHWGLVNQKILCPDAFIKAKKIQTQKKVS